MAKKGEWAFAGLVTSINVKGRETPASHQCLFSIQPKKGEAKPFLLHPFDDPARYAAMLQLLTSAFAAGAKVFVNTVPGHEPPYVFEIEVRPSYSK